MSSPSAIPRPPTRAISSSARRSFGNEAQRGDRYAVIELAVGKWQSARVSQDIVLAAGAMGARVGEHRRVGVDPGDFVALGGEAPGEITGAATDLEYACAGLRIEQRGDQSELYFTDPSAAGRAIPGIVLIRGHRALLSARYCTAPSLSPLRAWSAGANPAQLPGSAGLNRGWVSSACIATHRPESARTAAVNQNAAATSSLHCATRPRAIAPMA